MRSHDAHRLPPTADRLPAKWRRAGSNRQPPACKAGALPIELRPRNMSVQLSDIGNQVRMGAPRFELGTSALSGRRSNQLSYAPSPCSQGTCRGRGEQASHSMNRWPKRQTSFAWPIHYGIGRSGRSSPAPLVGSDVWPAADRREPRPYDAKNRSKWIMPLHSRGRQNKQAGRFCRALALCHATDRKHREP